VVSVVGAIFSGGLILGPALLARLGVTSPWPARAAWAGAVVLLGTSTAVLLRLARRPSPDEAEAPTDAPGEADGGARPAAS
jgi:hypothetical protein